MALTRRGLSWWSVIRLSRCSCASAFPKLPWSRAMRGICACQQLAQLELRSAACRFYPCRDQSFRTFLPPSSGICPMMPPCSNLPMGRVVQFPRKFLKPSISKHPSGAGCRSICRQPAFIASAAANFDAVSASVCHLKQRPASSPAGLCLSVCLYSAHIWPPAPSSVAWSSPGWVKSFPFSAQRVARIVTAPKAAKPPKRGCTVPLNI